MICRNHVDVSEGVQPCARCGSGFCTDCVVTIHGQPYCAVCKTEKLLDVQSGTDRGQLLLATIGRRFAAMWIDWMIFLIAAVGLIVMGSLFLKPGGDDSPLFIALIISGLAVYFIGFIIYEGLMLSRRGQTLGKMALKIKVIRPDGSPITTGQAWGRSSLRGIMVHVLLLLNYIPALATKERTCIHDLVAGTRVVNVD
jgi:uncharacterized RDD family membrane protein YckC